MGWEQERNTAEGARDRATSGSTVARASVCRSNAPNLSIKTAVISATTTLNNLTINYWQALSFLLSHTFSLTVYLSVSPFSHSISFLKIRHRLQHESCRPVFGSVTSDFPAMPPPPSTHPFNGISSLAHSLILSVLPISPSSVAMAPARSPQGPSYLHSSDCSTLVSILSNPASCQRKAGVRPLAV